MPENPTLSDVIDFVLSHATENDLPRIADAVRQRRASQATVRGAAIAVGATVRLDRLRPRYLNTLTGTVTAITGQHATVRLDEVSTGRLRRDGFRRYAIPADATSFDLGGVPLSCCHPTA